MNYKIIDFHTHPFMTSDQNICNYKKYIDNFSVEFTKKYLTDMGITKICGMVFSPGDVIKEDTDKKIVWESIKRNNDLALELKKVYGDFYEPGFSIHPALVKESCDEIDRMHKKGVKIVGELLPYWYKYSFASDGLDEIIDYATQKGMIINLHTCDEDNLDAMVKKHRDTIIVGAHPGELPQVERHLKRMKESENYYIDISGTGLFRLGMLRRFIKEFSVDRILFGTDYPVCSPAMYVGGIALDSTFTEEEKIKIFSGNAERLLYGKK